MNILVFIVVLTVLVLIHELGHFLAAKLFGIKVEEFGFGLPPRAIGKKIGETVYSLNWLPIGGFVKLYGEDEAGGGKITAFRRFTGTHFPNLRRAFYGRPWWQKSLVIVAGVFMNFILAWLIISALFAVMGVPVPKNDVLVAGIVKDSPADKAGIKTGDIIEFVNNIKITQTQQLVDFTKKHLGEKLSLKVKSGQGEKVMEITPRKTYPQNQGPMGIVLSQSFEVKKYSLLEAPIAGFKETLSQTGLLLRAGGTLISQIFSTGQIPEYSFAGPVGIAQLQGELLKIGLSAVLSFVAILSLNLAIINLLPIPGLDGGRLFFILLAAISGKKIHPRYEGYAHTVGYALLLALILAITFHDITRLISGQPILPK